MIGLQNAVVAPAQAEVSRFLTGAWASRCDLPETRIRLYPNGKLVAAGGEWGCLIAEIHDGEMTSFGPSWNFKAKCDRFSDRPAIPGDMAGNISGEMRVDTPRDKAWFMLRIFVNRPARPDEKGLWAIYPTEMHGPYARCSDDPAS